MYKDTKVSKQILRKRYKETKSYCTIGNIRLTIDIWIRFESGNFCSHVLKDAEIGTFTELYSRTCHSINWERMIMVTIKLFGQHHISDTGKEMDANFINK